MKNPLTKLMPYRRRILVVAGALTIAAILYTLLPAIPRSVDIVARLNAPEARDRSSSLVISADGRNVVEAQASPTAVRGNVLEYSFWLAPKRHDLEFRVQGCPPLTRTFDPRDQNVVAFVYRCAPSE